MDAPRVRAAWNSRRGGHWRPGRCQKQREFQATWEAERPAHALLHMQPHRKSEAQTRTARRCPSACRLAGQGTGHEELRRSKTFDGLEQPSKEMRSNRPRVSTQWLADQPLLPLVDQIILTELIAQSVDGFEAISLSVGFLTASDFKSTGPTHGTAQDESQKADC